MSFCPHCGAATQPAMTFCTACGRELPATPIAMPPPAPGMGAPASAFAAAPTRPVGKVVQPGLTVLLTVVTFTIYSIFFWWRASRETDAATGSRAHSLVRTGIFVQLGAAVLLVVGVVTVMAAMIPALEEADPAEPFTPAQEAALMEDLAANPIVLLGVVLLVVGMLVLYTGLWRMWNAIHADESAAGATKPLNPGILTGVLVGVLVLQFIPLLVPELSFISYVGWIGTIYLIYVTQDHLNGMWTRPAPAPLAPATPGA